MIPFCLVSRLAPARTDADADATATEVEGTGVAMMGPIVVAI